MSAVPQRRRMRESLCREGKSDSGLFQDVTPGLTKLQLSTAIWGSRFECAR